MMRICDLRVGALYMQGRVNSAWERVPWFKISDPSRSSDRPNEGEVLIYLGRGSAVVKGRGINARPDSWCFLRPSGVEEVYNSDFVGTLRKIA